MLDQFIFSIKSDSEMSQIYENRKTWPTQKNKYVPPWFGHWPLLGVKSAKCSIFILQYNSLFFFQNLLNLNKDVGCNTICLNLVLCIALTTLRYDNASYTLALIYDTSLPWI